MANIYSKFNCGCNGKTDCRAYYFKSNGSFQRIGADEFNNVKNCMNESEVELIAISINIPFSELKTEIETMQDIHLPDSIQAFSEFESFKVGINFIGYAKVSNIKASTLVPKTEFSSFDIFKVDGTQKKWKEFLEFTSKNSSYFLKIIQNVESDFKLFYDYFKISYEVITEQQYNEF